MTPIELYAAAGRDAGCPADQMERFLKAGIVLQPRQLAASAAARLCDKPDGPTAVGYGGARGGGKSHWILAQVGADDCQRVPGLKCLLLRKVGRANMEHFGDVRQRLFGSLRHTFAGQKGVLTFANGSRIIAGHFQKESDIDAYLGLEYDVIAIEEATTLSSRKHRDIATCLRTSKPNWRPREYSNANPGGIGHAYYKARFITPFLRGTEVDTRFIPAKSSDNAFNNPEYQKVLDTLTGWQRRAWRDGDWDIAAGQFFTTFRRDVHVIDHFDDSKAVAWDASLDYGFTHYTCVYLGATDGDGNLYVVDEHAERLWLPSRHVPAIRNMVARHDLAVGDRLGRRQPRPLQVSDLRRVVAGADVFSRESDGSTVAKQYAALGISLRCANTDRVQGWANILERLGDVDAGVRPSVFIHSRCGRLLECLPSLQHDPNKPEDVLKVDADEEGIGGDDPADSFRYLVHSRPLSGVQKRLRGF
jgi:phage terminase large subunit